MTTPYFDYFINKKILITGGAGYLAYSLTSLLSDVNCSITRLDLNFSGFSKNGKAKIKDVQGDISKTETFDGLLDDIDIIFHFAAQTSVYKANENPMVDWQINVVPMLNMLEICRKKNLKPVILFSGTVTEAGMPVSLPVNEKHPDNPITIYDLHKLMSENYLKYYVKQDFVKGAVLRLANVYGPGPKSSSVDRGILNMMIRRALNGENLTLYGDGKYIRDYIYVKDVARAFLFAASNIEKTNGQHFVIGSGNGITIADAFNLVVDRVSLKTSKKVEVNNVPPPSTLSLIENRNFVADSSKFMKYAGWNAEYTLNMGIDAVIESM
ncbi:MAG: NAD-dependent epimerase/dehydratase family protein [Elusimicrobiota bacterium]